MLGNTCRGTVKALARLNMNPSILATKVQRISTSIAATLKSVREERDLKSVTAPDVFANISKGCILGILESRSANVQLVCTFEHYEIYCAWTAAGAG